MGQPRFLVVSTAFFIAPTAWDNRARSAAETLKAPRTVLTNEQTALAKELIRDGDGADHEALVIRNRVFSPHQFDETLPDFSTKQYLFLNAYRYGVPFDEACAKSSLTPEQAERFLDKPKVRAWLADRAMKDHIKREWEEPGRWYQEGEKMMGQERVARHKVEIWKEFGARVARVPRANGADATTNIEIHVDASAVRDAFRRKEAIEAEISK